MVDLRSKTTSLSNSPQNIIRSLDKKHKKKLYFSMVERLDVTKSIMTSQ